MANLKLLKNKVLLTGANGLLGQKIVASFADSFEIHAVDLQDKKSLDDKAYGYTPCDITKRDEVRSLILQLKPNFVINAAAYTDVDGCEDNREACWRVNVIGVDNLAQAARRVGALLIHISTDYVFDGVDGNYHELSKPNPLSYYGRAKLAGENAVIISRVEYAIVRTMILYGFGKNQKLNFATWLLEKLSRGETVTIVDDQFGQPTFVDELAQAIRKIVELKKTGIFHIAGSEYISR
ncbi:MAG: SDR family oxidoreductase, partial [bacterium]